MQTNIKDINTFISNKFSLRNIAESMLPKTGTRKLNIDIVLTLLYFKSSVHSAKATEDISAMYIKRLVDFNVNPVSLPPKTKPMIIKIKPPKAS